MVKLHEVDVEVADFLMVGLDPKATKDIDEEGSGQDDENGQEWEQGLVSELDDILEDSTM